MCIIEIKLSATLDKGKLKRFNSSASKIPKLKNNLIGKVTSCDTNRPDFFAILYFITKD